MNSYQSTIDSQSDSYDSKYGDKSKKSIELRRISRRQKVTKIFKFSKQQSKIQIQEPSQERSKFNPEVKNYVDDIVQYISTQESYSIISENYMQWQTDINTHMREILVGWLIQVSSGLELKKQTLHLAALLVDKFCYSKNVLKRKYQVLGGACLYIAAKYQEISTPRLKKYVEISDGAYTANQLLFMESQILLTLNFNLQEKSTITFFQIKGQQFEVSKGVLDLGYFLLEMCLVQYEFCRKKPTYLSLAILYTSMKLNKKKVSKIKVFASQNGLDEEIFTTYIQYSLKLFGIRHLPKFSPVRKRFSSLFTPTGELIIVSN